MSEVFFSLTFFSDVTSFVSPFSVLLPSVIQFRVQVFQTADFKIYLDTFAEWNLRDQLRHYFLNLCIMCVEEAFVVTTAVCAADSHH